MRIAQRNGNDRVYTPPELARAIVNHFDPPKTCSILEPCAGPIGRQSFVDALIGYDLGWYELDEGTDFLKKEGTEVSYHYDWVITNPPWSKLRAFLNRSMEVADNVVFLCLVNAFFMKARLRDMEEKGFGIREILFVPTPLKPWPQTGFALGAVHIKKGLAGNSHNVLMSRI